MNRGTWIDALSLRRVRGVGDRLFRNLVEAFGSPTAVLKAGAEHLARVEGVGPFLISELRSGADREWARREVEAAIDKGFSIIVYGEEGYPPLLAQVPDPPAALYLAGDLRCDDQCAIAVVGSRKSSSHGVRFASKLAGDLALAGVTVVSGLAQGIDAAAHRGALEAGGRTIAVFGAGLDVVYPGWNGQLAVDIRNSGAWISEFPLGSEPLAHHFPRRNRIISGLSLGVVVVEAAERSGTLITAEAALEQGRDVFAVPGLPGAFNSRGTHRLLRSGAKLVESVDDVLEELQLRRNPPAGLTGEEAISGRGLGPELERTLRELEDAPLHIDEISARSGLSAAKVGAALMELCLLGRAEEWSGKRYSRGATGAPLK